jgi:hypothetical protein
MEEHLGEEYEALIISVQKFGCFVELFEVFVEGLLPINALEEFANARCVYRERDHAIVALAGGGGRGAVSSSPGRGGQGPRGSPGAHRTPVGARLAVPVSGRGADRSLPTSPSVGAGLAPPVRSADAVGSSDDRGAWDSRVVSGTGTVGLRPGRGAKPRQLEWHLGDKVRVRAERIDPMRKRVEFALIP